MGYLTELTHGAGSPQAQREQIAQQSQLDYKNLLAQKLAGIQITEEKPTQPGGFMEKVFQLEI